MTLSSHLFNLFPKFVYLIVPVLYFNLYTLITSDFPIFYSCPLFFVSVFPVYLPLGNEVVAEPVGAIEEGFLHNLSKVFLPDRLVANFRVGYIIFGS